ncbi:MAG: AMIN domain-containing protein [Terriglobales bacterium]
MSCARAHLCAIFLAACAISSFAADAPAAGVQSVKVIPNQSGATVEILATRPLTPKIQTVESPSRLVIDLPGSILNAQRKRIPFRNQQIKGVRMNQYQADVTRIVLDLSTPVQYTWDALGNRVNIHVRPDESSSAKPLTAPAMTPGTEPIAVPYAEGSTGTLVEAGSRVASGSTIAARDETAVLRLARGGEIRVCAQTTVSVATSPDGQSLMLGMNTGAMETHYHINESSDSILTPDFRIVLPGPGEFNLAIKSDAHGDTCVGSLAGSNSSVVVAELLGNGTYEIKPEQQVLFRQGKMQSVETPVAGCGCPAPQEPVMRAAADPTTVVPENKTGDKLALTDSNSEPTSTAGTGSDGGAPEKAAAPNKSETPALNDDNKAQISAPLVFNAKELARARAEAAKPAVSEQVAAMPLARPADPLPALVVLPPAPKPEHKGFFGRIGHFFRSIF